MREHDERELDDELGALERDVERLRTTIAAKERRGHPVPDSFRDALAAAEAAEERAVDRYEAAQQAREDELNEREEQAVRDHLRDR